MVRRLRIEWQPGEKVTGRLAMPATPRATGLLLAHGAGAGQDSEFVVSLRDGVARRGFPVLTFNYPYTEAGRKSPDRPERLLRCHAAAAARLREYCESIVLGGKSMGGRLGSHLAADGEPTAGLVYFGYPLLPPGRPTPRETDHWQKIDAPMLFFCGTRDRLCPLDLLQAEVAGLSRAEIAVIEDGDHSFRVPKRSGRTWDDVLGELATTTSDWMERLV